jgi:hypothetical protein
MRKERRGGGRTKAVLPIGVRVGRRKLTAGCTLDAGPLGALILCTEEVEVGTVLHVTDLQTQAWLKCRVVRNAGRHESGRHALGVEIVARGEKPKRGASRPAAPRRGGGRRSS